MRFSDYHNPQYPGFRCAAEAKEEFWTQAAPLKNINGFTVKKQKFRSLRNRNACQKASGIILAVVTMICSADLQLLGCHEGFLKKETDNITYHPKLQDRSNR